MYYQVLDVLPAQMSQFLASRFAVGFALGSGELAVHQVGNSGGSTVVREALCIRELSFVHTAMWSLSRKN